VSALHARASRGDEQEAPATPAADAAADRAGARPPGRIRARMLAAIDAAAIEVFARDGYQGATTQAIADAAGLGKAQLHYYIGSKEALYQRVLQDIVDDWIAIFGFADAHHGPRKVLSDYIRRKMRYSFEHPARSRIFAAETMRGAPLLRPLMGTSHRRTMQAAAVITGWIDAGLMRPLDPLQLLFHIWAVTQHYADYEPQVAFFRGQPLGDEADRERLIDEVTAFVLRGAGVVGVG
jgi:TetR/AcrR family transcriptional regulator